MAGQIQRPWFRLGSITRPAAPTAPAPAPVRPPVLRPMGLTPNPSEPASRPQSAEADAKSPPNATSLPRITSSVPSSPAADKVSNTPSSLPGSASKKSASQPSPDPKQKIASVHSSPQHKAPSPSKNSPFSASDSKLKTSLPPSPTNASLSSHAPSPVPSPTAVNSKPNSPSPSPNLKPKAVPSPPSPLTLPPSQVQSHAGDPIYNDIPREVEQKTVVVQKTIQKTSQSHNLSDFYANKAGDLKTGKQEMHKDGENTRPKKNSSGSEQETNTKYITIAGENRGAFMEVIFSDKNYKSNKIGGSENEEGKHNNPKDKSKKSKGIHSSLPMNGFFNSNVQGINNSIMVDSSFTHHDPGFHIILSRKSSPPNDIDDEQLK